MNAQKITTFGHLASLICVTVWGATFISTKILLQTFTPAEILFIRCIIASIALFLCRPQRLKLTDKKQEFLFIGAGLSGITLYFLFENIALTCTAASNVSVIITVAPFFTALFSAWFLKSEKPRGQFYIGFLVAIMGVGLISYNGSIVLELNPLGDLLAVLAALAWAIYSILTKKIGACGYNMIVATRRVFFYGLLFMIPVLLLTETKMTLQELLRPLHLGNFLFLGLGASALCFVIWNIAVKFIGAVKTSVYIYLVPVVTVAISTFILKEPLTPALVIGTLLTLIGLWLSETRFFERFLKSPVV